MFFEEILAMYNIGGRMGRVYASRWRQNICSFSVFFFKNLLRRVNQQVQNYKTCLKNSHLGVEKFNFSLGLSFSFFCIDIILLSV